MTAGAATHAEAAAARRRPPRWLVPIVLVLVGVAVLLYPVIATTANNSAQRRFAEEYRTQTEEADPAALAGSLAAAREYNGRIHGIPVLDPYLSTVVREETADHRDYLGQLADLPVMARLRVPRVGIDLPVRHGTDDEVLATGVGHLYGTSLPVGGAGTHAVLTSHSGLPNATLFDPVHDIEVGDRIVVEVHGERLDYEVHGIEVVEPTQIEVLGRRAGEDLLTLFTCTPYGVNSHRLMVEAHRVETDVAAAAGADDRGTPGLRPWMLALLGVAGAGVALVAVIGGREVRRRRPR